MKKLSTFSVFISMSLLLLFSCQKRQYGYFNNHYPQYTKSTTEGKAKVHNKENNSEPAVASLDEVPIQITTIESSAKVTTENISNKKTTTQSYNSLSKQEKRNAKKEIKREFRKAIKAEGGHEVSTLLLVIIAILLPPLAVLLVDEFKGPFWLSLLLWLLFYVPGLIYALWRVLKKR